MGREEKGVGGGCKLEPRLLAGALLRAQLPVWKLSLSVKEHQIMFIRLKPELREALLLRKTSYCSGD